MSDDDALASESARPATVDDLKHLIAALDAEQVDSVLIGGKLDRLVLERALEVLRRADDAG